MTPGPKTTFGPMIASRPIWVSSAKNTVSGAVRVTPFSSASARARAWKAASACGELRAGVDAQRLGLVADDDAGGQAARRGRVRRCRSGSIRRRRCGCRPPPPDRTEAARRRRSRRNCRGLWRVPRSVASLNSTIACSSSPCVDQAAIAARVGGLEAQHDDGMALRGRPASPRSVSARMKGVSP